MYTILQLTAQLHNHFYNYTSNATMPFMSPYERLQEHAAVALRNLSVNDANEAKIAEVAPSRFTVTLTLRPVR